MELHILFKNARFGSKWHQVLWASPFKTVWFGFVWLKVLQRSNKSLSHFGVKFSNGETEVQDCYLPWPTAVCFPVAILDLLFFFIREFKPKRDNLVFEACETLSCMEPNQIVLNDNILYVWNLILCVCVCVWFCSCMYILLFCYWFQLEAGVMLEHCLWCMYVSDTMSLWYCNYMYVRLYVSVIRCCIWCYSPMYICLSL